MRSTNPSPWARYAPKPDDPWDLRKVAHLHRRAGFGAPWAELLRDQEAGPDASVDRLFRPPRPGAEEIEALEAMRRHASPDLLKVCWLHRILYWPDPLREKLTLFWHGHFATSIKKVESVGLMDGQNETLHEFEVSAASPPLGGEAVVADPAMLVWLDGGTSKKEKPNENFAREFLELFCLEAPAISPPRRRAAARWRLRAGCGRTEAPFLEPAVVRDPQRRSTTGPSRRSSDATGSAGGGRRTLCESPSITLKPQHTWPASSTDGSLAHVWGTQVLRAMAARWNSAIFSGFFLRPPARFSGMT